jgi:transposase
LRAALNSVATMVPEWLTGIAAPDWFERYTTRVEEYRLPKREAARTAFGVQIGVDGHRLLNAVYEPGAPAWLRELPAVQTLRRAWVHQFYVENGMVIWRKAADLPPAGTRFDSPYNTDAHYGNKRSTTWTDYKVHVTETCDADAPHLVINVDSTPAQITDSDMTAPIQQSLLEKNLAPSTHFVDAGYVDADLLVASQKHGIELLGSVRPDVSWQAKDGRGFDISSFKIDWEAKKVTCPQGQTSVTWKPTHDHWGNVIIHIGFQRKTCAICICRPQCTQANSEPRELTLRPRSQHETLQNVRRQQKTEAWRTRYGTRAGIEGTLSQAVRGFGLRRCRYIGLPKTNLQHVFTAIAINIVRLDAWLTGAPIAKTRRSAFASLMPVAA